MTAAEQTRKFATDYQALFDDIISTVEGATDEQWRMVTASEQWPVGVVAHHLAMVQDFFVNTLQATASGEGELANFTIEQVHENNARHAVEHADATKNETLELLKSNTPRAVQLINSLNEKQMESNAGNFAGNELTVALVVEWIGIGHHYEHLESIKATLAS